MTHRRLRRLGLEVIGRHESGARARRARLAHARADDRVARCADGEIVIAIAAPQVRAATLVVAGFTVLVGAALLSTLLRLRADARAQQASSEQIDLVADLEAWRRQRDISAGSLSRTGTGSAEADDGAGDEGEPPARRLA